MPDVYINSIKEVVAKDGDLSWKYVIKDIGDEGVFIEYYEISLDGKRNWEKKSDFRIDLFCAKQVFETGLKVFSEI
ncbi:MAG: hypothetical protein LLF98_02705 [Clostridium sp.]|uniref:hypothetical protein n=1 Tax=Clostridium sp. TaxID=1506 RepID=UPI0025B7F9E7|nr:hypothetical protein [Clostridium sp.]MCE5220194.1 hypothetical protein [Clostridium sp.]